MFDTEKITINAAFYEMFENIFEEDFFVILTNLRQSPRILALRKKNAEELSEEEQEELLKENLKLSGLMKKYTPRIAYIGTKLYNKQFNGSYDDYLKFLSNCEASDFLNPEIISKVWGKINLDQKVPDSVKNA